MIAGSRRFAPWRRGRAEMRYPLDRIARHVFRPCASAGTARIVQTAAMMLPPCLFLMV